MSVRYKRWAFFRTTTSSSLHAPTSFSHSWVFRLVYLIVYPGHVRFYLIAFLPLHYLTFVPLLSFVFLHSISVFLPLASLFLSVYLFSSFLSYAVVLL